MQEPKFRRSRRALLALTVRGIGAGLLLAGAAHDGLAETKPDAGAAVANPAPPSAEDDKTFIIDFLEKGYLQAWFAHPSSVRQHFADPVDVYWTRRNVPLNAVVREKLGYARKWIFRFYRLQRDTVKFEPVSGQTYTWRVTFQYDFVADSAPPRSEGVGETTLLIELNGDQVKIHGESGRVLERKKAGG